MISRLCGVERRRLEALIGTQKLMAKCLPCTQMHLLKHLLIGAQKPIAETNDTAPMWRRERTITDPEWRIEANGRARKWQADATLEAHEPLKALVGRICMATKGKS